MVTGEGRHVEPERRNVGFMFQDYALFPHLSVRNNILFGLREIGREAAHERCARIIARLGIDHLADRHPHMLSGGEQQRVALARAVVPQPEVLLMDEPFSNLDRGLRNDVREQTVSLLRELGTTVLMVTHDPEEALSVGDRVALMRDGQLEQIGAGADLYNHPASVYAAEFFGIVNRLTGTSQHGRVETRLGHFMMPHAHDGQTVSILIRPHDLRLAPADDGNAGTVSHCTLMGEVEQICVSMDGLCKPLIVRSTNWLRLDAGTRVSISVEAGKALLF
jgi:iron(III) transport system ATP-binding protein